MGVASPTAGKVCVVRAVRGGSAMSIRGWWSHHEVTVTGWIELLQNKKLVGAAMYMIGDRFHVQLYICIGGQVDSHLAPPGKFWAQ